MKEKFVMTTFVAGQIFDASLTTIGLGIAPNEKGVWMSSLMETSELPGMLAAKIAVTSVVIGLYAISKSGESWRASPIEKGLVVGNLATWVVVALNAVRIMEALK